VVNNKIATLLFDGSIFREPGINLKKTSKRYSIDSIEAAPGVLLVKLWISPSLDIRKIFIRINDADLQDIFLSAISYRRDDAANAIGAPAVGISIMVASREIDKIDPKIKIKLAIVDSNNEVIVDEMVAKQRNYKDLIDGIIFDLKRRDDNLEIYLNTSADKNLLDYLIGLWKLYLLSNKNNTTLIRDKLKGKSIKNSIVTIFYKNLDLVSLFPIISSINKINSDTEVILCFQEAVNFANHIEIIKENLTRSNINFQILLISENIGFSAANNMAANISRGKNLLFLNPDILCDDIRVYSEIFSKITDQSIIGATLFGSSGDIMHNGIDLIKNLTFSGKSPVEMIRTSHIGRHDQANQIKLGKTIQVKATSGAALGISKKIFIELNGFSEDFIFAHFEDIDLCMRAIKHGVKTFVLQTNALTHIESYSSGDEVFLGSIKMINSVIFNKKYKNEIQ
jgi:GT2 family glycosyltransferase